MLLLPLFINLLATGFMLQEVLTLSKWVLTGAKECISSTQKLILGQWTNALGVEEKIVLFRAHIYYKVFL